MPGRNATGLSAVQVVETQDNPSPCTRSHCVNCLADHSSASKSCPKFIQLKEIITIQTDNKCSFREAINIQKAKIPPTFNVSSPSFSNVLDKSTVNVNNINELVSESEAPFSQSTNLSPNSTPISMNSEPKENRQILANSTHSTHSSPTTMAVEDSETLALDYTTTIPLITNFISHLNSSSLIPSSTDSPFE
ncbi:unnamed protein product [Ceratitis capitata]|uniref:(Mediterranean fruit fly) hypothetical protein n=1 Tax=Ceratitis capitata TaxID=7213 RepID=A0A811U6Y5_CERCA|nr:unnamed protein product [Ceratitis capitata]